MAWIALLSDLEPAQKSLTPKRCEGVYQPRKKESVSLLRERYTEGKTGVRLKLSTGDGDGILEPYMQKGKNIYSPSGTFLPIAFLSPSFLLT